MPSDAYESSIVTSQASARPITSPGMSIPCLAPRQPPASRRHQPAGVVAPGGVDLLVEVVFVERGLSGRPAEVAQALRATHSRNR